MQIGLACRFVVVIPQAAAFFGGAGATASRGAELTVDLGSPETFGTAELLARPEVATIEVPHDASYGRPMTYRALPLRALLGAGLLPDHELQVVADDGFVTNLPEALVFPPDGQGAVPWLAIEPPDRPWPPTATGLTTGPFYLVWLDPEASGIRSEQWPFAVASMRSVAAGALRWPQMAVGAEVPADSPIRAGQALYVTQCMVCHRIGGAGDSEVGPDLNQPRSPTEYLQPWALKALLRDPKSLRTWPDMRMPGFTEAALSDADIDAVIAYLAYMAAGRR